MEPIERSLRVPRTARYFMLGNSNIEPSEVVFVLHGYGMAALPFLEEFRSVVTPKRWIVAPEGLSRFYRKGFAGEVVASWMTREDRHHEIADYTEYLDLLYRELVPGPSCNVRVIGFSQGAATASRWIMHGNSPVTDLVIWGGDFAPDITSLPERVPIVRHVMASDDEFISLRQMEEQNVRLRQMGLTVVTYPFRGHHAIHKETLEQVVSDFVK